MGKLLSTGLALLLCMAAPTAKGGDPVYPAKDIPDSLKKDAHLVRRIDETTIRIIDETEARVIFHYVTTVLDEAGAEDTEVMLFYNKLQDIRSISGALFDAEGRLVKRLKQSDIQDVSGAGGGTLMTDTRIKHHQFNYSVYPYTVEYTVEMRYNSLFFLPSWTPQAGSDCTVELGKLTITAPATYALRYQSYRYNGQPVVTTEKENKIYTWEVKQLPAMKKESYATEFYRRTPSILLCPSDFTMGGFKGNLNTWKDFGKFAWQLNEGRDVLPDAIKSKVATLTQGLSREEKIKALYRYLQQNYRYIDITLGIGGWQTFDAASVAANGYGDCKALTNFMMSMLKEAGIRSNWALVKAGDDEHSFEADFPSPQFNHVILCVPGEKDTTWLECTSNTLPAGYLGNFTDNRPVLLVDAENSKLAHTPVYGISSNEQIRHITATIDSSGNIDINASTFYTGLQQDHLHDRLHSLSREKQLELLRKGLDFGSYDINDYQCKENGTTLPSIEEHIQIKANNYATVTGKRMFVVPNIMTRSGRKLEEEGPRVSELQFEFPYRDIDSASIILPAGYKPESLPQPVTITGKFGHYSASVSLKGNTLTYIRKIEHKDGIFPAADYPELVKFYGAILRSDRSRLVLVKE
ncbi:DUF3857 domain-containing protein [Chitinophaga arvensicola]|uniref:Transglutaminase-like superfamily protein n=1 Tax=Chitinophaga arvensicola TaxID=29529 RepID=A0A1I0RJK9_9BACT|nr:DUF3857 domain-containing protein [Chitinophaga arvensicola]SEW41219.1 Transglutaminase-like superfamily protein [Chitinophaga arvensicola]